MTFTDRVPKYPGRIKLTPVSGQEDIYDLTRADEPIVVGTPVNAALFEGLQQETDAQIESSVGSLTSIINGSTAASTGGYATRYIYGSYTGNGTYGASNPVSVSVPDTPKLLIVQHSTTAGSMLWLYNDVYGWYSATGQGMPEVSYDSGTKTISWYHRTLPAYQLNQDGAVYNYLVIM